MSLYTTQTFKKGSIIYMENSKPFPYFFIIKSGKVKESLSLPEGEESNIYHSGDTLGLITCLTGQDYLLRLTAITDCELITVVKENLIDFLSGKPQVFLKIIGDYSNRLRELDKKLINLTSKSLYNQMPEQLLNVAYYYKQKDQKDRYMYALIQYCKMATDGKLKEEVKGEIISLETDYKVRVKKPEKIQSRYIYKTGDIIFLEQEKGDDFYFIEKGKVKISHIDKDREFILSILGEKEFFGEMAVLNRAVRSACAIAYEDTRLLKLNKDNFMDELSDSILKQVFVSFAKRIWYSYRRVINLSYRSPISRIYDCLDLIIKSRYATKEQLSYHFDISLHDLKVMTNIYNEDDDSLKDFLEDSNIVISYGQISIVDYRKFKDSFMYHICRERKTN